MNQSWCSVKAGQAHAVPVLLAGLRQVSPRSRGFQKAAAPEAVKRVRLLTDMDMTALMTAKRMAEAYRKRPPANTK